MEHIRQFDWYYSEPDVTFLRDGDFEHSATEKIVRNKFRDPMISSDSEEEHEKIDWKKIFQRQLSENKIHRIFVPCLRTIPPYPKLSLLSSNQHYQCMKVLSSRNPHVLSQEFMPRATKQDYKLFEDLQEVYEKEQKEYIAWAKTLWANSHCTRALRPKPPVETVYEAQFKVRANELKSYPQVYEMVAQIPFESKNDSCEMIVEKDLISVNISTLPQIELPDLTKRVTIMRPCSVPEPCNKHLCRFVLPTEKSSSILPLPEVQRELAQYAAGHGAQLVASEAALACLLQHDRPWTLPLAVCGAVGPDGEKVNVVVLGSEFPTCKESAVTRTHRAFRHLLQLALIPPSEKIKLIRRQSRADSNASKTPAITPDTSFDLKDIDVSSDEEDNMLVIDIMREMDMDEDEKPTITPPEKTECPSPERRQSTDEKNKTKPQKDYYQCSCKDSIFELPPPRSYRKWRLQNNTTQESLHVIIHCPHKVRNKTGEVILEPIPEYQLDLGASLVAESRKNALALSLLLRKHASLMAVRLDGASGEVCLCEQDPVELTRHRSNIQPFIAHTLYAALANLQGLLPGMYLLTHAPTHGANALLYSSKLSGRGERLELNLNTNELAEEDEASKLKNPPTLAPIMLPIHKFRKILPCTFTPVAAHLARAREPRRRAARHKTPPQAIKWPKRNLRKRKKD